MRASTDTKIINPVCACSAPFLLWEMACSRLREERTPQELYQPVLNSSINTTCRHCERQVLYLGCPRGRKGWRGATDSCHQWWSFAPIPKKEDKYAVLSKKGFSIRDCSSAKANLQFQVRHKRKQIAQKPWKIIQRSEVWVWNPFMPFFSVSNFCCIFS